MRDQRSSVFQRSGGGVMGAHTQCHGRVGGRHDLPYFRDPFNATSLLATPPPHEDGKSLS